MNRLVICAQSLAKFVAQTFSSPVSRDKVIEKIRSFGSLPEGWDFGVGHPASTEVIHEAVRLYSQGVCMGLRANAFPGTGGDVYLAFYKGIDTVEICVLRDLSFTATLERGLGVDFEELDYRECLSFADAIDYLSRFALESRCNFSEPYIAISMTRTVSDSQVIASRTTKEVFQSSTPIVSKVLAWTPAAT